MSPVVQRDPRRGAVTVWLLACLAIIVGILAIGLDGGRMLDERQHAQAAADAAALAAGANLYANYSQNSGSDPSGTARAAALQVARDNGYTNDGTTSIVTVNIPPQSGPFAGQTGYAEVVVESLVEPGFSAGLGYKNLPVRARAVARGRPLRIGMTVLEPTGAGALLTQSLVTVQVLGGPIRINSSDPAAYTNDSLGLILADNFQIVGGYKNTGGILLGNIHTGVPPAPDPLRTIPAPNPASYPLRSASTVTVGLGLPRTLQPGVYQGGIKVNLGGVALLQPGVYILNGGGLSVAAGGSVVGLGVMIYNTGGATAGPININALSVVALSPMTDPTYGGITIFQDRTLNTGLTLTGINLQIGGTIYAATAPVTLSAGLVSLPISPAGALVCWQLTITGLASFALDLGSNSPRVPDVRLVD
jgi:hypothetical protein